MYHGLKSQITPTQRSASPGDGTMGTTDPDYGGVGMGPGARRAFVRFVFKKHSISGPKFVVLAASSQPAASSLQQGAGGRGRSPQDLAVPERP